MNKLNENNFFLNTYSDYFFINNIAINTNEYNYLSEGQIRKEIQKHLIDNDYNKIINESISNFDNNKSYTQILNSIIRKLRSDNESIIKFYNNNRSTLIDKSDSNFEIYKFYTQIISSLRNDDFEYGKSTKTEKILKTLLAENIYRTKEALQKVCIKNYSDKNILCGLLRVISHFDYYELTPQNILIATSAIAHRDEEVIECAIRCCENWDNYEVLNVLRNVKCHSDWMNDYLNEVIASIARKSVQ
jgi:hypothetical protein